MATLYIIAGCNGAGKTTASFTILPEMLNCDEFINADEIARGLSPLKPEKAAIEAGRLMLTKIDKLISSERDFAFETTLATKSYVNTINRAKMEDYRIVLVFFWLESVDLAIKRVQTRVLEGGHDIPEDVIYRRYFSGLKNLFNLYLPICEYWMIFDNSITPAELVAEGNTGGEIRILNQTKLETMENLKHDKRR